MIEEKDQAREEFEKLAQEMFGGDMGVLLNRNPVYPDEYSYCDVQAAWRTFQAGMEAGRLAEREQADNARLIAAAMLESLQRVIAYFDNPEIESQEIEDFKADSIFAEIEAAIRLAKGEPR